MVHGCDRRQCSCSKCTRIRILHLPVSWLGPRLNNVSSMQFPSETGIAPVKKKRREKLEAKVYKNNPKQKPSKIIPNTNHLTTPSKIIPNKNIENNTKHNPSKMIPNKNHLTAPSKIIPHTNHLQQLVQLSTVIRNLLHKCIVIYEKKKNNIKDLENEIANYNTLFPQRGGVLGSSNMRKYK